MGKAFTRLWQALPRDDGALVGALAPPLALLVPLGQLCELPIVVPLQWSMHMILGSPIVQQDKANDTVSSRQY